MRLPAALFLVFWAVFIWAAPAHDPADDEVRPEPQSPFERVGKTEGQIEAAEQARARQKSGKDVSKTLGPMGLSVSALLAAGLAFGVPRLLSRWLAWSEPEVTLLPSGSAAVGLASNEAAALVAYMRKAQTEPDRSKTIFEWFGEAAAAQAHVVREHFANAGCVLHAASRKEVLAGLMGQIRRLEDECKAPEMAGVRELVVGLDGLVQQVSDQPSIVTSSTLRTIENAITLLGRIRPVELSADLTKLPSRFLVVDDEPISRHAVSAALKKCFQAPDFAENGESALRQALERKYDAIFLDVEMPEMDGFEVCCQIREMDSNRRTPVVFVTSHRDLDTRTKSAEAGGHDLLGKPFLSNELTVKTLTLVLGGRLDASEKKTAASQAVPSEKKVSEARTSAPVEVTAPAQQSEPAKDTTSDNGQETAKAQPASTLNTVEANSESSRSSVEVQAGPPASGKDSPKPAAAPERPVAELKVDANAAELHERPHTISFNVATDLRDLRKKLRSLEDTADEKVRDKILGQIYIGIQVLAHEAEQGGQGAITRLAHSIQGLVAKVRSAPHLQSRPVFDTVFAALEVMEELCARGFEADLEEAPLRILLVDDDPVALRATTYALNLRAGRPECATSGEEALAHAREKAYDVIFLDVLMPGMDGFATCERIRETDFNKITPVVFITNAADLEGQARGIGGNAFLPKPVLPAQVALAALTYALRGSLDKLDSAQLALAGDTGTDFAAVPA